MPQSTEYYAVHAHMRAHHPKAGRCEKCGREARTDYATLVQPPTRRREDYLELCRSCHKRFDYGDECAVGHPFDAANTYWWGGLRHCRACRAARARERRERQASA